MDIVNIADLAGFLFLGFRPAGWLSKGAGEKGGIPSLHRRLPFSCVSDLSLCGEFFAPDPAVILNLDNISVDNDLYRLVMLSGFQDQAEEYVRILAARVISLVATYVVVRLILRTAMSSLRLLTKVPGLSFLNRLAGAAFGLLQQMLVLWILFLIVAIFSYTSWGGAAYKIINQSVWLSELYNNNLLLLVGMLLMFHI